MTERLKKAIRGLQNCYDMDLEDHPEIKEVIRAFDEANAGESCAHDSYRDMSGDWKCLKCGVPR